ncbi:MAG TPA: efflux RND transporter periplasmic adaptor subunit, partial [Ignavibacteriales bacterium]|nr:efflux RND transporter periplasmic adaptor subunit [Ignavibacteriales bacterium]
SGTIEETESVALGFAVPGTVSRVYVNEGDFVRKGQLLAELNSETLSNSYQMAEASYKQAQDAYSRLEPMHKNGNLPEIKFVEIQTGLQQAKSAAAIAKKNLNDCKLYATMEGYIGRRSVDPGMTALPGIASITVVKISKVYADVSVPENEIAFIEKGQKGSITISALKNASFTGTVEEVGVMADPLAHTYKIKILIPNEDKKIKPGMICNVSLASKDNPSGVVVPNQAILVDENGKNYVYTIDASAREAAKKFVRTGELLNNGIEIIEGLNENEIVAITGQQKLLDKSLVNIINR